ncbi:ABC transporter permease [Clostridium sp.]|uniref:ABC transporter permease n=1 Tax=Clostridium sp. TaxID=1506 RepID=UPI003F394798
MNEKYLRKILKILNLILLPIIIIVLWIINDKLQIWPETILPTLKSVGNTFLELLKSGVLINDIKISLFRVVQGFIIASLLGITLGVLMGMFEKVNRFFQITFSGVRQIPMLAWVPLIILWFGIGEKSKVIIIVLASFFPILLNTINGISQVPKNLVQVGKMFNLSHYQMFTNIYLKGALPSIFVGLRLGLGISWMAVVGAELVASSSGIGYRINDARSLMMPEVVIVGMIVIAILGMTMDLLLRRINNLVVPWSIKGGGKEHVRDK